MTERIRVGIVGYGNLGRGAEHAIARTSDIELVGVFTRRDPASLKTARAETPVHALDEIDTFRDRIDVLILCGGSRDDLPEQGPTLARHFNTVDSFDTHARIPAYFERVDEAARAGERLAVISVGWDPGLFSVQRLLGEAILPAGKTYTFWGEGLSQGHSDAVRRVPGVRGGVQYTVPSAEAIERVRRGEEPELTTQERHTRVCYVVLEEGADASTVEEAIVTMPDYFVDYETTVHFISEEELRREHSAMPHGGLVFRSGQTGSGLAHDGPVDDDPAADVPVSTANTQVVEYSLALESNPEFTASVLVAYARAAHRLHQRGERGARTVFDIAPGLLSPKSAQALRAELL